MNRLVMIVGVMAMVIGCGGAGGGGGGSEETTSSSGGSDGGTTTVTTTSTTTSGTGGSVAPTCGASVPKACSYPEDALGFDPADGMDVGPIYPYPGRADLGGSASCMGPFDAERSFTRALVGFPGPVPGVIALDVWTQDGRDPGKRVPEWTPRTLVDVTDAAGITFGRYEIAVTVPAGEVVCVGAPLAEYTPRAMTTGACYEPRRTWWYGLPIVDGIPSWAMLECPEDDAIAPYGFDLPYGLE